MKTVQLLLVEDDPDNLEVMTWILGSEYQVVARRCAAEALEAASAAKPDILVLDIGMTPMNGVDCLKAIRVMPGYGGIPAIALTAYARVAERENFLASGFQEVVTKPILDQKTLFAAINRWVSPLEPWNEGRQASLGMDPAPGLTQLSGARDNPGGEFEV